MSNTNEDLFCSGVYSPDYDNCSNVQYVNKQPSHLGKGDFGSGQDLNHWLPPHDSASGGDSVNRLSAIPSVSFRSNSFTICRPSSGIRPAAQTARKDDSPFSGIQPVHKQLDRTTHQTSQNSLEITIDPRGWDRSPYPSIPALSRVEVLMLTPEVTTSEPYVGGGSRFYLSVSYAVSIRP